MQPRRPEQDPWEWRPDGPACQGKHTWVFYHSRGFRECMCCGARQDLWADFGVVRRVAA